MEIGGEGDCYRYTVTTRMTCIKGVCVCVCVCVMVCMFVCVVVCVCVLCDGQ